jgi:protein-disulfide isomerase
MSMRILPTGLLAALALAAALPAPAEAPAEMSEAERAALHAEIRAYLLANPELLTEMLAILEAREQAAQAEADQTLVATHAPAIFDDGYSFVGGNPDGAFTVVEFLDYQCGFCRRAHPDLSRLIAEDGDIRWIVKELPILGPGSELAARAAVATLIAEGPERYAALNDRLMRLDGQVTDASLDAALAAEGLDATAIRAGMQDAEIGRRLDQTRALAQTLGISGTPTFVFENRMVRGYLPLDRMQDLVAELRAAD